MNNYTTYNNCIIRTPLYPFNYIDNLDDLKLSIFQQSFREAILIATPVLYNELYVKKNITHKTIKSAIKYYLRGCTRCTPYGAFAGCDIIRVAPDKEDSEIQMARVEDYSTFSRIDMNYLCEYIRILDSLPEIRNSVTYHLNTSSYFFANSLRYIEYKFIKNRRKYVYSEIGCPPYLSRILKILQKKSLTISQIASMLVCGAGVEINEATDFINELIEEQILVSNLEPSVIGEDLIYQLKNKLVGINYNTDFIDTIIALLKVCDEEKFGKKEQALNKIYNILTSSHIAKQSSFIHVDTLNKVNNGVIGNNIIASIKKCLYFFSKFQLKEKNDLFDSFKKKFYDKYEEQEIPLVVALDPHVGLGYGLWTDQNGDMNPLLQGLPTSFSRDSDVVDMKFNPATTLLLKKYEESIKSGDQIINITDADLDAFKEVDLAMPQCAAMFSVLSNEASPSILLKGIYGGVTSRLLSRFEYLDDRIESHVNEINKLDDIVYKNCIVAEVAHLPEDRVGNIQMHPNNRKFSICYLSNPEAEYLDNIPIEDIMISVPKGRRIVLRSRRYNQQIVPMLATAHNSVYGLPIYSFLSDYISQDAHYYYFEWGTYFNQKPYLPRVSYNNIILKPARWVIHHKQVSGGMDAAKLLKYKQEIQMPDEVLLCVGDHQLYINFKMKSSLDILCEELVKKNYVILEEFLFNSSNKNLVKSDEGYYTNEIILNLYKQQI